MVSNSGILKKILKQGDYHLCFKIIPYVCIGLVIFNLISVVIDSYFAPFQFPDIRIGSSIFFFICFFYYIKTPEVSFKNKLIFELILAAGLPLTFSFFMFSNYSNWYFYCNIFLGGLLYGLVSGHFLVPVLNFPLMYYSGYLLYYHLIDSSKHDILEQSIGTFIVIWFSVLCTTAARIGFDVFYLLNLSLQENKLNLDSLKKLKEEEMHKLILEKEINKFKEIETVGKFAGGIAHDFNNMLTVISGQMMYLKRFALDDWEKIRIDTVMQSVKKTSQLIKSLLCFTQNKMNSNQVYSINEKFLSVISIVNNTPHKAKFNHNISSVEFFVSGNPDLFCTTFINLILTVTGNASQDDILTFKLSSIQEFKPEEKQSYPYDGSSISKHATLNISCSNSVLIENVISHDSRVFADIFNMIKNHNGCFNKEINDNYGNLTFFFPCVDNSIIVNSNGFLKKAKNTRIMVVDDDVLVLKSTEDNLISAGYQVITFDNGKNALHFFENEYKTIDLVILDMRMPEMTGGEVLANMRSFSKETKVLIMTGYSSDIDIAEIIKSGASGLLEKPFTEIDLFSKIESVLKKYPETAGNSFTATGDQM